MGDQTKFIENTKVYTSYFARAIKIIPNRRLLSVALSTPDYFEGAFARQFNPSPFLIHKIKNKEITPAEYEEAYRKEVLDNLDAKREYEGLAGKVLCCWEKPDQFCHRHIIMAWLQENLGEGIVGGEV